MLVNLTVHIERIFRVTLPKYLLAGEVYLLTYMYDTGQVSAGEKHRILLLRTNTIPTIRTRYFDELYTCM